MLARDKLLLAATFLAVAVVVFGLFLLFPVAGGAPPNEAPAYAQSIFPFVRFADWHWRAGVSLIAVGTLGTTLLVRAQRR